MERNLVLPAQPPYQETDAFEEAKLYIERVEQENNLCQDEKCIDRNHEPLEGTEPFEHRVSLTACPIRVSSMHFTCATVQWDMPDTETEEPFPDTASDDNLYCSDEPNLEWTANPISLTMPSLRHEDIIDLISEEEAGLVHNDAELQQGTAVTVGNQVNSCQTYGVDDTVDQVCVTPSNAEEQAPCKDISQTSEASVETEKVKSESNTVGIEVSVCTVELDIHVDPESSKTVGEKADAAKDKPEQALEDSFKEKEIMGLYSENGNEKESVSKNGMCSMVMAHIEEDQYSTCQLNTNDQEKEDAQQNMVPDLIESDQTHLPSVAEPPEQAERPVDIPFNVTQSMEATKYELIEPKIELMSLTEQPEATGNSENSQQAQLVATLDMISDDETLKLEQLQHTETFQKKQVSVWVEKQGEPTCEEQMESSVETELAEITEQLQCSPRIEPSEESECLHELEHSEQLKYQEILSDETSDESENVQCSSETELLEKSKGSKDSKLSEQSKQSECPSETGPSQLPNLEKGEESGQVDHPQQTERQKDMEHKQQNEDKEQSERVDQTEQSLADHMHGAKEQLEGHMQECVTLFVPQENGRVKVVDREEAQKLAERLYKLDDVQRTDVVRHLDKDNEFSRAVGEEYLKFYDFTDQSLDEALRSFLKEVVLIGETQERERVLDHFSNRYQQCNPNSFSSPGSVLTLTCAVMLLNTDLHGQNVGKAMSIADFVANLDGMNEGENFNKDLLKTLYNSIKNHPLEWAVEEKELVKSITLEQESDQDASLRSKSNPFQDLAHDKKATVFQKGFLKRKAHADIDGKRTPWGKRSWKTFYAVLKGMVLYLQKDEYRKDWQSSEEVLSVHHSLAERAENYTKRPHVFRLQTADWRVFLFEAASTEQMNSWIGRINLVSALYSSPPFPAAVGSQRKFCRPILPATQSTLTLEKQLQSHSAMLQSFKEDLNALQQGALEGRKAKVRELEGQRLKEEYLQHERSRYETYLPILEIWQRLGKSSETAAGTDLVLFDQELWRGIAEQENDTDEMDGGIKRSHSSPSLELEVAPPPVVKVRRNISERRTYRKIIVPRRNKEL